LNRAIELLQGTKHRGRPPKNPTMIPLSSNGSKGKRVFTVAQRREQAKRMKAYWAAKKAIKK
jgi:hypothetical protein